jgi:hypothetical protein
MAAIDTLVGDYFKGIFFTKISTDVSGEVGEWVAQLTLESPKYERFLILTHVDRYPVGTSVTYDRLVNWVQFSAKDMHDSGIRVPEVQHWLPPSYNIVNQPLTIVNRTRLVNEYMSSALKIHVSIAIDIADVNCHAYPDTLTLQQAINTFRCNIIKLK